MEAKMKKLCVLLGICLALLGGCALAEGSVVATSFPCYDFARQVAGDEAEVQLLIPPGTEVHSYEPAPSDILAIGGADLFVYIGGESDAWVDGILESLGPDAPAAVRLIDSVAPLAEEDSHGHAHEGVEFDEHIWTSPKNAVQMVWAVEEALCAALPESEAAFRANADAYAAEIERIDAELTAIVEGGVRRELVFADRFPFLYLAHDYGLEVHAAFASCTAETEPSAQTLVELIQIIESDGIPAVYTIEMSTGAIARTIAEETGVEILTLHSMQTVTQQEFDAGETYVTLMERNLEALRKGLSA